MSKQIPKEYADLLDIDRVLRKTPGVNKLKVTLRKDPIKGSGLYATKNIKKGELIAYYRIYIFDFRKYNSPTHNMYTFNVYTKLGKESKNLIGDLTLDSIPDPINNIPFWAPFVNEPSLGMKTNAEIDLNLDDNYYDVKIMRVGKYMDYKLFATKNIKAGEEIMIYYGEDYVRNYKIDVTE